jgi:uncharacterized protein (DUF924 family)
MDKTRSPDDILEFWFGTHAGDTATAQAQKKLWWAKDAVVDAGIRERYGALVAAAAAGAHREWAREPRGRLALILLFDQFPRNIYRDTPQAFAHDGQALRLALDGVAAGADRQLRAIERVFLYLPLEHAESTAMQEQSVELFTALAASAPEPDRPVFAGYLDYALRHRDVMRRFGRFPHRNRILRRASTPEEIEFLKQPGSSF